MPTHREGQAAPSLHAKIGELALENDFLDPSSTAQFSKGLIRNGNRRREGALALQFQIGRGFRGSAGRGFADGRRQRDADGTQGQAGGRTRRGADDEALVVVLDLGLGQRVQIGDDLRP